MTNRLNYFRRFTIALIISGALNIAMLAIFIYLGLRERPPTPYYELKPANLKEQQSPLAIDHSNSEVVRYFKKMSLEWLVARLNNLQLVENGYTQRDLALAALVDFHYFDLERALAGLSAPSQKRMLVYGKFRDGRPAELMVYPGLTDRHYEAIVAFATTERWPLTSHGLFLAMRKAQSANPSLAYAFSMTPEFLTVEMLFGRGEVAAAKQDLIEVLVQGDWQTLSAFVEQQRASQDLSAARRQRFLLDYIKLNSKAAANLMLKTDGAFAAHRLDDANVMLLLQLLEEKNTEAEQFASALLTSPRSDDVWKMAATRLYEYAGESMPEKNLHHNALSRFMPQHLVLEPVRDAVRQAVEPPAPAIASAAPPIPPPPSRAPAKPQVPPATQTLANSPPASTPPAKTMPVKSLPVKSQTPISRSPAPKNSPAVAANTPSKQQLPIFSKEKSTGKPVAKPTVKTVKPPVPVAKNDQRRYIVQDGDTLWKISQRFNVDVQQLKSSNKLDSDALRPGRTLRIP